MNLVFLEIKEKCFLSPFEQPYMLYELPPPPVQSNGFSLNNKVSPSILLIITSLAIIFFVYGLLHLLVRFLLKPSNRDPDELDNVTSHQDQLQQLFHLHDSGVDQSFIDTLPVFNYKSIIGLKNPFDCAVCLCEFEAEDKLRLLPKCSHAFHMECIDTWLLAHSTCPICRASLFSDFSTNNGCSSIVLVLESGNESSSEIVPDQEGILETNNSFPGANSHLGARDDEFGLVRTDFSLKFCKNHVKDDENQQTEMGLKEKVLSVKLGKYINVDGIGGGEGRSNKSVDSRRCFSMGSFAYMMDENTSLQVPIRTQMKKLSSKKPSLPLTPGHRSAMSECDSRRGFNGFEAFRSIEIGAAGISGNVTNAAIGRSKKESFSVSKIWLHGRKDKSNSTTVESSIRTFSLRFPVHHNGRSQELGCDEEIQNWNNLDSKENAPSFTRGPMRWLMGRQNKVVHSSFSQNV